MSEKLCVATNSCLTVLPGNSFMLVLRFSLLVLSLFSILESPGQPMKVSYLRTN